MERRRTCTSDCCIRHKQNFENWLFSYDSPEHAETGCIWVVGYMNGLLITFPDMECERVLTCLPTTQEEEHGVLFIFKFPGGYAEYRWHKSRKQWVKLEDDNGSKSRTRLVRHEGKG